MSYNNSVGGDYMKPSLKHDILLTFLILLSILLALGCAGCTFEEAWTAGAFDGSYYMKMRFSTDDIMALENIYQVKFPQSTQFIKFVGTRKGNTGDTNIALSIILPEAERDTFASDWFKKNPHDLHGQSFDKYFAKSNSLLLSKMYYNHDGDSILQRFKNQRIDRKCMKFLSSGYGWSACIVIIIVTNVLFKRLSKKGSVSWAPPD